MNTIIPYIETLKNTSKQEESSLVNTHNQHIEKRSVTEILFENKNKKYGAYQLRRAYGHHVLLGLAFAICMVVLGLLIPYLADVLFSDPLKETNTEIALFRELQPPPGSINLEYVPPVKIVPPEKVIPVVVKDSVLPEKEEKKPVIKKDPPADNVKPTTAEGPGGGADGPGTGSADDVYFTVDELPKPPGGSLAAYLSRNLRYPADEQKKDIQGKVIISCIINKDGSLEDIRLIAGVSEGLNNEALRIVRSMPNWTPARRNSEPVRMYVRIPINFTLKKR